MNYKNVNYLTNKLNKGYSETDEPLEFDEIIDTLLQDIKEDSSEENIGSVLSEFVQLRQKYNFSNDEIYTKFNDYDMINLFFSIIFPDESNDKETKFNNIELIFQIFTLIANSHFFPNSFGLSFLNSFFQNYDNYDMNCQNFGIITVSQIISNFDMSNQDEDQLSFDQKQIDFLISIFPEKFIYHPLVDSLSLLYVNIAQRSSELDVSINQEQQIADALSGHISNLFLDPTININDENNIAITFFHNYSKFMLIYLQHNPPFKLYMKKYFKFFGRLYNFSNEDIQMRNNIFDIYTILTEKDKTKFVYSNIISIPDWSIYDDLQNKPDRRLSIFKYFLEAANKRYNVLEYMKSNFLDIILKIQNDLSYECLNILYLLLDCMIYNYEFTKEEIFEISFKIVNIFLKMLNVENSEFKVQILNSICKLLEKLNNYYAVEQIKDKILECEEFEALAELREDYDEAQLILSNLEIFDVE